MLYWNISPYSGKAHFKFTDGAGPQSTEDGKILAGKSLLMQKKFQDPDDHFQIVVSNYHNHDIIPMRMSSQN